MTLPFKFILSLLLSIYVVVILQGCLSDPPEPTGTFSIEFTGTKSEVAEGNSFFTLSPSGSFGILVIRLEINTNTFVRLSFFSPDASEVFLEPGTYAVVDRLADDLANEVLVDYVDENGSFSAQTGQVRIGIVKNNQISGEIINADFPGLESQCSGSFDAIPQ